MNREEWTEITEQSEEQLISAIKKHLLTLEQKELLFKNDLDIADLLNGRFMSTKIDMVIEFFKCWNQKLGWIEFKF